MVPKSQITALTSVVNLTDILRAVFLNVNVLFAAFIYLQFGFAMFGLRILAQKLLVKCW